jgi:hypothetical protein
MAKLFAAGESPRNEALAEFFAQDDPARPPDPSQRGDMMRSAVLTQVNACWLHMTEGHAAPGGTERDYLDSLVGRLGTEASGAERTWEGQPGLPCPSRLSKPSAGGQLGTSTY